MHELMLADEIKHNELCGESYVDRSFAHFSVAGRVRTRIRDVEFERCRLPSGPIVFLGAVELRKVAFRDTQSGGRMSFATSVLLDRVRFTGRFPESILGSSPSELAGQADYFDVEWALDVTDYFGDVAIYGPPLAKIRCDPERHVKIRASKTNGVEWEALGVPKFSYWRIAAKRASVVGVEGTVAMIPASNSDEDLEAREQLARLRAKGILE